MGKVGGLISKLIYIADDVDLMRTVVEIYLKNEGYVVQGFQTGDQLYLAFLEKKCDLIILDIIMPGNDGLKICSMIREISDVPIIMLTALDSEADYITGISQGSDIYLTKPFKSAVLAVHVKALLNRFSKAQPVITQQDGDVINFGNMTIYRNQHIVKCHDIELKLTYTEFKVLIYMFENHPNVVTREDLLVKVWKRDQHEDTRAVDDLIRRMRRKLSDAGSTATLETVWRHGFKLGII